MTACMGALAALLLATAGAEEDMGTIKSIDVEVILNGRTHNQCWFSPGLAVVPPETPDGMPEVHIGVLQLTGNDTGPQHWTHTRDLGGRWTPPMESQNLLGIPRDDHFFEKPFFAPRYHRASGKLILLGATHFMRDAGSEISYKMEGHDWKRECPLKNTMAYTAWDPEHQDFLPWKPVALPLELDKFHYVAWPKIDIELDDGTLLCPFYTRVTKDDPHTAAGVMHAELRDDGLHCLALGNLLRVDTHRGLAEPSIVRFQDRFLMTVRHNERSYVCVSNDGLHYDEPREWLFDDGEPLGNYNTQQHWLAQKDRLYLLYNRRSELGNGVFRHRAPLFIAEVDTEALRVVRDTEQIVFPENGARMGNFNVVNVTENEAWVVTGEWLEAAVPDIKPDDRFYADALPSFNRIQYLGDLLLARIRF
ncbi:MAG: hypothetical protein GY851_18470 [bacterium]|nr:hypothetical protein [bacterium]